jgi:hypothetical protein
MPEADDSTELAFRHQQTRAHQAFDVIDVAPAPDVAGLTLTRACRGSRIVTALIQAVPEFVDEAAQA